MTEYEVVRLYFARVDEAWRLYSGYKTKRLYDETISQARADYRKEMDEIMRKEGQSAQEN